MTEKQFCSCCLSAECCKTVSEEYKNGDTTEIYSEMLLNTFNINVSNSQSISSICEVCITKLRDAATFKTQVLKTQEAILKGWNSFDTIIDIKSESDELEDQDGVNCSVWNDESFKESEQACIVKLEKNQQDNIENVQSVTCVKNMRNENVSTAKSLTKVLKRRKKEDTIPTNPHISQAAIDARENTLKLIQNSNLCLFRSLKTKFGCFVCKASFVEVTKLREHSITHTNKTILAYRFQKLRGQSFKNADISDLKCKQCSESIPCLNELMTHLKEKHNLLFCGNNHYLVPYKIVSENQCVFCAQKFNTFLRLSMHMNTHYTNNVCEICGLPFINRMCLRVHVSSQHREKKCSLCPAKFLKMSSKTKHLKKVHNVFNLKRYCNMCDKTFPYTYMLENHKIKEHGAKKTVINCDECGKIFHNETNLQIHIRSVHIKERNFPCVICGKSFFTKSDQKRHEVIHSDVRSFSCTYCDTKFKSKDSWRRHMKQQHGHVF